MTVHVAYGTAYLPAAWAALRSRSGGMYGDSDVGGQTEKQVQLILDFAP